MSAAGSEIASDLEIVVAAARNGTIGADGTLPWRMSSDLKRFKALTTGHSIIMGRRTQESIGRKLPGRQNIVVTSRLELSGTDAAEFIIAGNLDKAIELASGPRRFVVGGAQLYAAALPRATRVHLTLIDADVEGDTFFPLEVLADWKQVSDEYHTAGERDDFDCRFQVYER